MSDYLRGICVGTPVGAFVAGLSLYAWYYWWPHSSDGVREAAKKEAARRKKHDGRPRRAAIGA